MPTIDLLKRELMLKSVCWERSGDCDVDDEVLETPTFFTQVHKTSRGPPASHFKNNSSDFNQEEPESREARWDCQCSVY